MAKKIYEVFQTATDAYLEYVNSFLTKERFTELFNLDEKEVDNLFYAVKYVREHEMFLVTLDYYFNKLNNQNYSEKNIHW